MKLSLLSLCIYLFVEKAVGQCHFSSIDVVGDYCNLGPVDLQHGESVDKCGLVCVCDRDHLHCCLESSCAIVDHTTSSVTITSSGPVASQSKRRRRSFFFDWIVKRLQRLNYHARNLFREKRESQTTTPYTTLPDETPPTTPRLIECYSVAVRLTTPLTTTTPITSSPVASSTTPGGNRKK